MIISIVLLWGIYFYNDFRKVVSETDTGTTEKSSVRLNLNIQVETIFFDVQVCVLRVNGRNVSENKYVKVILFYLNVKDGCLSYTGSGIK